MITALFHSSDPKVQERRVQLPEDCLSMSKRVTFRAGGKSYGSTFKLAGKVGNDGEWVYEELQETRVELTPKGDDDPALIGYEDLAKLGGGR